MDIKLSNVRFSYLTVYEPRAIKGQENSGERFSAMLLGPKGGPAEKEIEGAIDSVAKDKWGPKAEGILKQLKAGNKLCLKNGDERLNSEGEVQPGYAGHWYISASSTADNPPRVYNRFGDKLTAENQKDYARTEKRGPRSGDYGDAIVRIWAQDNDFGKRVNCQLVAIAFRKEGEPLGRAEKSDDELKSAFGSFDEPTGMME